MDLPSWKHDLRCGSRCDRGPARRDGQDHPEDDAKLQHLKDVRSSSKIARPINPGNRKVLIFTAFADTAKYLYENLAPALLKAQRPPLRQGHRRRRAQIHAEEGLRLPVPADALLAPRPRRRQLVLPDETGEIDILIGTDCISEGQNLQDCDYLINYDIHWNPVRIIQRFGRIDRIGSPNAQHPAGQLLAGHHARRVHQSQGAGRKPDGDRRRHGDRR